MLYIRVVVEIECQGGVKLFSKFSTCEIPNDQGLGNEIMLIIFSNVTCGENKHVSRMRIVLAGAVLYSFMFCSYTLLSDHFLSGAVIDDG
jgi:glycopeptide antibiotics resistance protein